jgi:hypothetical protein
MFSDEFKEKLSHGKYTRWAVNLTEEHLHAVLWQLGEFACRADSVIPCLWRRLAEDKVNDRAIRALARLAALASHGGMPEPGIKESLAAAAGAFLAKEGLRFKHPEDASSNKEQKPGPQD